MAACAGSPPLRALGRQGVCALVCAVATSAWSGTASGADVVAVRPETLARPLADGWEATDEDPPDGVAGLDRVSWRPSDPLREPGPYGAIRWYRVRLDLTACRGLPIAFYAPAIRDSDETYLDGARIGATGAFPPRHDPANLQARLYALPTDAVNAPGVRTLALRVYHGPRHSSTFREMPVLDRLTLTAHRSWLDQTLAALAGLGAGLAVVFAVFYLLARREKVFLAFGGFSLFVVLYLLSGHSAWGRWPVRADAPFRFAAVSGVLLFLSYLAAVPRLLQVGLSWRFRLYRAGFLAYAVAALATPDLGLLVGPTRAIRILLFVCLGELVLPTVSALRAKRRGALTVLVGHGFFAAGLLLVDSRAPHASEFYAVVGVVLVLLALGLHGLGVKHLEGRIAAVLEERYRIARELHDTLAQSLVGISVQLESVAGALGSPGEAARHLDEARALVRTSLADARRSVLDLRPQALEGGDLAAALRGVAEQLTAAAPIEAEVRVRGTPRRLPESVQRNLLSIGREALTNAVRHAGARRVEVRLAYESEEVELDVVDDGHGFTADAKREGCFGLRGIEERAREMGARLVVRSAPQEGTSVAVAVPARADFLRVSRGGRR